MSDRPRPGVAINGGKAHVRSPTALRGLGHTRCGIRIRFADVVEDLPDVNKVDPKRRCRKCFPGSGERA